MVNINPLIKITYFFIVEPNVKYPFIYHGQVKVIFDSNIYDSLKIAIRKNIKDRYEYVDITEVKSIQIDTVEILTTGRLFLD